MNVDASRMSSSHHHETLHFSISEIWFDCEWHLENRYNKKETLLHTVYYTFTFIYS